MTARRVLKRNNMEVIEAAKSMRQYPKQRGVTLVELVLVILLIGIVSAVAMSRILSSNSFNALLVRDQIISIARIAQNARFGRAPVTLTVQPSADGENVTISAAHGSSNLARATVDASGVALRADINITTSCAVTAGTTAITNSNPLTISYNPLGSLGVSGVTGSTGTVSSAARICINSNPAMSVCFSPSGYAYIGSCDE